MSVSNIKIKALNSETGEFKEKLLTLATLRQRECLLGRHPSCDLVLDSAEVSRIHGRIWCQDEECFYTDLGSTDGSQIDDREVEINQAHPLKPNNLLRIGVFVLTIAKISADDPTYQLQPIVKQVALASAQSRQGRSEKLAVRCIQVIDETHDVKTFRFVAEPPVLFSYKPGQFVTLDLEIEGKRVMRSYSISSTPSRPHILEITVKRVPPPTDVADAPPGLVSNWLHEQITVGSQIKLKGPMGNFTCVVKEGRSTRLTSCRSHAVHLPAKEVPARDPATGQFDRQPLQKTVLKDISIPLDGTASHKGKRQKLANGADKLLFISAGSGITPMMSMSRWLCDTGANVDVVFIHSARSPRDFIFRHELELMAARYANFKLAVTTTRSEPGQAWVGYTGRLNELMVRAIAPDFLERTVYVCGSNPFLERVKTMLETLLFPMENYHQESFGSSKRKSSVKEKREDEKTKIEKAKGHDREDCLKLSPNQEYLPETAPVKTTQERSPVVVFTKVGKAIPCDEEDTILEIAEQEGIELPSGCRMGACGSCKLALLEGEVNYDDCPDCEPGHLLSCIAKPVGRVVIEA